MAPKDAGRPKNVKNEAPTDKSKNNKVRVHAERFTATEEKHGDKCRDAGGWIDAIPKIRNINENEKTSKCLSRKRRAR
jgi:hypothetical protein